MSRGTFAFSLILAGVSVAAYGSNRIIPRNPKPGAEPVYDTTTVIDVMASVTEVWEAAPFMPLAGVHLTVRSGSDALDVYLGPADFVKSFGVTFARGDSIEVIGSQVMADSGDVVLAGEIRVYARGWMSERGGSSVTMTLRDKDGKPYWKDSGRGPTGK